MPESLRLRASLNADALSDCGMRIDGPLAQIGWCAWESVGYSPGRMGENPGATPGTDAIAGRIGQHQPHRLTEGVDRWQAWMESRGRRAATRSAYGRIVKAWSSAGGYSWVHDLSYANIEQWLAWKRSKGEWAGKSYNYALAAFRSLTGYMARLGWLPHDTMDGADRSNTEESIGARAATTDEVRRFLEVALLRQGDGRSKGFRFGYWAFLVYSGARYSEPGKMRWSDLDLDGEIPTITWRPEAQKVGRRVTTAMHPDLARILRWWRDHSADPSKMVFPIQATRPAFKDDASRAKIDLDGFSPHSLRKHFQTSLVNASVPSRLVDFLMRHSLGVQGAYYRPDLEVQAAALCKMPEVLTQIFLNPPVTLVESGRATDMVSPATPMMTTHVQTAEPSTASANIGVASDLAGGAGLSVLHGEAGHSERSDTAIGESASVRGADSNALAALLRAQAAQLMNVARLLDGGRGHDADH